MKDVVKPCADAETWKAFVDNSDKVLVGTSILCRDLSEHAACNTKSGWGCSHMLHCGVRVAVADVYKTWCGPCEVMKPTFERLYLENDQCDERCAFVAVREPSLPRALLAHCCGWQCGCLSGRASLYFRPTPPSSQTK